jgi:hypothetical protein
MENEEVQGALNEEESETSSEESNLASEDESQETAEQTEYDESEELPEEPDKQKEAFIKMRQENKAYKERLQALESQGRDSGQYDVLNDVRNSYRSQAEVAGSRPITPETPIEEISQRLAYAERTSAQAMSRAEMLETQLEDRDAEAKYPELKTDKLFADVVRTAYLEAKLQERATGKKAPSLSAIAGKYKKQLDERTGKVKSEVADEASKKAAQKESASLEARGSSVNVPRQSAEIEELRQKSREGDRFAAAELLKRTKIPEDF